MIFRFSGGGSWKRSPLYNELVALSKEEIKELREDYNLALNNCKIALCFLSKTNNDTYTRRCFEIPAAGTLLLSEYSQDLTTLFIPDKEAAYFSNTEELIGKIDYYLAHDDERKQVAQNGYERLHRDGHEIKDRAQQIIRAYVKIRQGE